MALDIVELRHDLTSEDEEKRNSALGWFVDGMMIAAQGAVQPEAKAREATVNLLRLSADLLDPAVSDKAVQEAYDRARGQVDAWKADRQETDPALN